jgi:heterodisulfide reductase subunit B
VSDLSYSLFPGCSLHSTGLEYGLSSRAVFDHIGLKLVDLTDWNCCGASSAHALDHTLALALPARNLALAQSSKRDLVAPCAACYNRMKGADHALRSDPAVRAELESLVGFKYTGEIAIRPLMGVLYEDYGLEQMRSQVVQPLEGLKVVTYYGCLLVRPPEIAEFDDPDDPQIMTHLLRAIGAEVMPWSSATDCCGGGLSLSRSDVVKKLVGKLAERALEAGANAVVTACPLCQVNLEMRQTATKVPVFYFTELIGLAFGLKDTQKWWGKHLIDPRPVLQQVGLAN